MQEIKVKANKHVIMIKVPPNMSVDAMNKLLQRFEEMVPGLNVMLTQPETEVTVLTLED